MAKIGSKTLSVVPSESPDVVGYKLYVETSTSELTYDSESFDLGTQTSVDLSSIPALLSKDGVFHIGITAVDDAGNESDMSVVMNVPLDFQAPLPPIGVSIQ